MSFLVRFAFIIFPVALFALPPVVDFTGGRTSQGWSAAHDIATLEPSPEGIAVRASGGDPFLHGPRGDFSTPMPQVEPLLFIATFKSAVAGWGQVFASQNVDRESQSAFFRVAPGWNEVCVPLPPMGRDWRLRFDPPGDCTVARLGVLDRQASGIVRIGLKNDRLVFAIKGVSGPVEIVELAAHQSLAVAANAPVIWKGDAAAEILLPLADGEHDRSASGFALFVPHPILGRVPMGAVVHVGDFTREFKDPRTFPEPGSKKGLQVQMVDDAIAIGVRHATLNVTLGGLIDLEKKPGNPTWQMDGETFAFRKSYLDSLPVKQMSDLGISVYLILLAYETGKPEMNAAILHPARDAKLVNKIAAFDTVTPRGARLWRATLEFLADYFSRENDEHGRVVGYIIGNEVNVHWQWHNVGRMPRNAMVADYERQVRIANTAVRRTSKSARVYISLTHFWTIDPDADHQRSMPGKYFIEEFARQARAGGEFEWHLAHHPYPEDLGNPRSWLDKTAPQNPNAGRITFKNLEQLALFFDAPALQHRGARRTIILSEQGFHSTGDEEGDRAQAAGYCYAWEKVARIPSIEAFILHRHTDHQYEGGLNLGLWRRKNDTIATPDTPRPMYDCFKAAGTPAQKAAFQFALPVIGIESWEQILGK